MSKTVDKQSFIEIPISNDAPQLDPEIVSFKIIHFNLLSTNQLSWLEQVMVAVFTY